MDGWPSGQWQRTVNPPTNVYVGSNPTPSRRALFKFVYIYVLFGYVKRKNIEERDFVWVVLTLPRLIRLL